MTSPEPIDPLVAELDAVAPGDEVSWLSRRADPREFVRALCALVERMVIGDLQRATVLSERLVTIADAAGDRELCATARRIRAQALAYTNNLDGALALLAHAAQLLGEASNSPEAARIQLATLHSLARQGRHVEAIAAGVRARDVFQSADESVQSARAEINIGAVERMRGEPALAIEAFARARGCLTHEPVLRAQLESNCAEAQLDLGRFDEAAKAFRESLRAFEAAGLARAAAIVEGNLADLFARQGLLEAALRHFEHAQQKFGSLAAPGDAARLEVEYADALAATGLRAEAIDAYTHALPVLREHKLAWEVMRGELGLGRSLLDVARIDEAETALSRAESTAETLGNRAAMARALKGRAQASVRRGETAQARSLLHRAESLARDLPVERVRIRLALTRLGGPTRRSHDHERELDAIVREAQELGVPPLLGEALHVRARYRTAASQAERAIEDYRLAIDQAERTRGMLQADRFRAAFAEDRHALYEEYIATVLDHDRGAGLASAFALIEQSKGRALLDILSDRGERPELPSGVEDGSTKEVLDELAARRADLNALYSELNEVGPAPNTSRARASESWSVRATEHERQITRLERRLAASMPRLMSGAASIDLEDTKAILDPGTTLLEYFSEAGMVSVITCGDDRRASVFRSLCSMDEVRDAMEDMHFEVGSLVRGGATSAEGKARETLRHLRNLLLDPVEDALVGAAALVVVPTGPLYGVPFHALWGDSGPLCTTCRVAQVPSASVLAQLQSRKRRGSSEGALVVGISDEFAPYSEAEAKAIAGVLPNSTLLLGKEATRSRVRDACREKSLIHIATHGRFLARNPAESGVRLADGWLTVREAYDLQLDGAHVTLSACDTGRVLASPADEAWGLVRGFLAGGAGSLLLSLWALNDASASEMMTECYRACHESRGELHPTESLRRVVMKKASAGANPLLWAPFVYVGAP